VIRKRIALLATITSIFSSEQYSQSRQIIRLLAVEKMTETARRALRSSGLVQAELSEGTLELSKRFRRDWNRYVTEFFWNQLYLHVPATSPGCDLSVADRKGFSATKLFCEKRQRRNS
jgi:hypothetical protein